VSKRKVVDRRWYSIAIDRLTFVGFGPWMLLVVVVEKKKKK
jgi:hypothetical protein